MYIHCAQLPVMVPLLSWEALCSCSSCSPYFLVNHLLVHLFSLFVLFLEPANALANSLSRRFGCQLCDFTSVSGTGPRLRVLAQNKNKRRRHGGEVKVSGSVAGLPQIGRKWRDNDGFEDMDGEFACLFISG